MQVPDLANGLFEALGAFVLYQNVKAIKRDKSIKGVDWRVTIFFTAWGFWNLFYYPSLDQWLSFFGGLGIVAVNSLWLYYAWRYKDAGS